MYTHTHNGMDRIDFPDGGCYLDQAVILLEVWEIIHSEIAKYRREQESG